MVILVSVTLVMMVYGVVGGINALSVGDGLGSTSWFLFGVGLVMFIIVLGVWFGLMIKENL